MHVRSRCDEDGLFVQCMCCAALLLTCSCDSCSVPLDLQPAGAQRGYSTRACVDRHASAWLRLPCKFALLGTCVDLAKLYQVVASSLSACVAMRRRQLVCAMCVCCSLRTGVLRGLDIGQRSLG